MLIWKFLCLIFCCLSLRQMQQRTEQELFLLMQGSSYPAFEELYNRLFKTLFKMALKKIGNADDAADLVQEVFMDFWDKRKKTVINIPIKNYLLTGLTYKISNYFRTRGFQEKHIKNFELFIQQEVNKETFLDVLDLKQTESNYEEMMVIIYRTIDEMPTKMKEIFQLSRSEKYTINEIADQLNISPQTVKNQISKAFGRVRLATSDKSVSSSYIAFLIWLTIS
jgi:RNA polymerase sigma-70 factor (family 1)